MFSLAGLAWTAVKNAECQPDYKRIKGYLNGGIIVPILCAGFAIGFWVWGRVMGMGNLSGPVIVLLLTMGLCGFLPAWIISKAITSKFL